MTEKEKIFKSIYGFTNNFSANCNDRNFNYFISNPKYKNISVTYSLSETNAFWGLHSSVNEETIIDWLIAPNSPFSNKEELNKTADEIISNKLWNFETDFPNSDKLSKSMCKRTLLSFEMHFYVEYKCSRAVEAILKTIWDNAVTEDFDYIDINSKLKTFVEVDGDLIRVNGRIRDDVLNKLSEINVKFTKEEYNGRSVIVLSETIEGYPVADMYKSHSDLMRKSIQCVSNVFYSGSLARVKSINEKNSFGNSSVYSYQFELESVTYATHLGLKDPRTGYFGCFFDDDEKNILIDYDRYEAFLQDELLKCIESNCSVLDGINNYLDKSGYTHGLNISSNLISSDGFLVFTQRGKKTFDSNTLYCSSNGVCEIFDENVSFYRHSIDCDLPSLGEMHNFGTFGGELTRETYAELGVFVHETMWEFYGFSVMGYKSSKNHRFPLHFNVLSVSHTDMSLENIRSRRNLAVEKDENEKVMGVNVKIAQSCFQAFISKSKRVIKKMYSHKDIIADILILFTVASLFGDKLHSGNSIRESILYTFQNLKIVDWLSLLIAALTLCFTSIELYRIISKYLKKYENNLLFISRNNKNSHKTIMRKSLSSIKRFSNCRKLNPIFVLMFQLYIHNYNDLE